jgi:hypothetical protein
VDAADLVRPALTFPLGSYDGNDGLRRVDLTVDRPEEILPSRHSLIVEEDVSLPKSGLEAIA